MLFTYKLLGLLVESSESDLSVKGTRLAVTGFTTQPEHTANTNWVDMHWVDIGVNLTNNRFQSDLPEVLARARHEGVAQLIVTGTDVEESNAALRLAQAYPSRCYATAGVHPHHAKDWTESTADQLLAMLQHPEVLAVGETGLDYNRNFSTPAQQRSAFEQQLELAVATQLPLFLHERDAIDDQINLLTRYRDRIVGGVAHCFTGSPEDLQRYLELDLYIGITGWVCDERRGKALQQALPLIPADRLLLESDAPYLLPRTLRPKPANSRNEPAFLAHIGQQVATLLDLSPQQLAQQTSANAQRLFAWPSS